MTGLVTGTSDRRLARHPPEGLLLGLGDCVRVIGPTKGSSAVVDGASASKSTHPPDEHEILRTNQENKAESVATDQGVGSAQC